MTKETPGTWGKPETLGPRDGPGTAIGGHVPGASEGPEPPERAAGAAERRTAEAFVELAGGALGEGLDPRGLLQTLVLQCAAFLPGCAAQAVAVVPTHPAPGRARGSADRSGGEPRGSLLYAGSGPEAVELAGRAVELDEGPATDCRRSGEPLGWTVLHGEPIRQRWPRFAQHALRLGHGRVAAVPMRGRGRTIGALVLLDAGQSAVPPRQADRALRSLGASPVPGTAATAFGVPAPAARREAGHSGQRGPGGPGLEFAQAMADAAGIALAREQEIRDSRLRADQLEHALTSRVLVEQAKGVLATRHGIPVDEAFELLRGYARRNRRRMSELAQEVIGGLELG
jgi:hypothetical protein